MQQQEALPTQPKGHTLFCKDARGLTQTQRVLIEFREALGTAGLSTCRSEVLAYQGAGKSEARTADTIEASSCDKSADRSRVLTHACPTRRW